MAVDVDGLRHGIRLRFPCVPRGPGSVSRSGRLRLARRQADSSSGRSWCAWQAVQTQRRQTCRSRSRRRYQGTSVEAAAGRAGAPLGAGRDGLREVGAALDRDIGHRAHMIGSVPRFVKADLIYSAPEDRRATAPDRPGPAQRHGRRRRGQRPPGARRDRAGARPRGRPGRFPGAVPDRVPARGPPVPVGLHRGEPAGPRPGGAGLDRPHRRGRLRRPAGRHHERGRRLPRRRGGRRLPQAVPAELRRLRREPVLPGRRGDAGLRARARAARSSR